jgi:hypothetical protein
MKLLSMFSNDVSGVLIDAVPANFEITPLSRIRRACYPH